MPDYRRTRNYQPDLQSDLDAQREALSRWNPLDGALADRGMDPLYADRYLGSEGSHDTLRSLAEALQGAQGRVENIDAGLGRSQDLIQEQKRNLQPLFDQAQPQEPGLMSRLGQGMGSVGSAIGSGLSNLPSALQSGVDNLAMRFQRAHAIGQGTLPYYLQEQAAMQQMQQVSDLLALKRADLSQKLQQQQLQRQQHLEDQVLGIWKDQNIPISMKKKLSEQLSMQGVPLAKNLMRLGDEQVAAEMETLAPHLPAGKLGELVNLMRQPNADLAPVEQWLNHARERKKAHGEAQMKSERFTSLLKAYQSGEMDMNGPDYDEFKQHVMEREKKQKEAAEMDLKLQQMGLTKRKAEQELQMNSVMPQYGPEVNLPGGNVQRDRFDPQTGQVSQVAGNKPPASVTNVNMKQESAFEGELGKENVKDIKNTQTLARDASTIVQNIHEGRRLLDSGMITGVGAEFITKFGQALQQTGFAKSTDAVKNTQAYAALMASNVAKHIKEFGAGTGLSDADREYATRMAGGDISLDEKSLRKILDMNETAARNIIKNHNKSVKGIKSMIPLTIDEPPAYQSPKKQTQSSASPYSDPDKERRYQEWKRKQGK